MVAARLPDWRTIRNDALAGVVVGIIALPLSIALAVAVGVPPVAGLYTAVFAGAAAAIFGGSNYNITGPTAALVPLLSSTVLVHGAGALPLVGLMAGLMLLVMAFLRLGGLIRFMPGPVIIGFTAGIALSIAFGQLNSFFGITGIDPSLEHFHQKVGDSIVHAGNIDLTTFAVGSATLAMLVIWGRLPGLNRIPAVLIAVVVITSVTWALGIETPTIDTKYGSIPRGFPTPSIAFLDVGLVFALLPAAFSVAVLGSVESLLSAVVADGMAPGSNRHQPNREIFGQGIANIVSPIMGGIPATAAIARTAAGIRSGARTRLTGVFHAATVLSVTLFAAGLAVHIPLTALSAILFVVAWNIAEIPELFHLIRRAPREDVLVLLATIGITLFFDLTYAIGFGIIASAFLLLRQLMQLPAAEELLPDATGRIQQVSPGLSELIQSRPDIAFFTAQGMLSFHSAAAFEYELNGGAKDPLILRMKDIHHIDTSGLLTLEGIIEHRQRRGNRILLTAIQPELYPVIEKFGLIDKLGPENVFEHTRCAIAAIDAPDGRSPHPSTNQ
jgi:SulP family sulfate permease